MTLLFQAVVNGLEMGLLYALVAVGLTIIWGLMEMINFAHGEFLMLGMFGAWWLSFRFGLDPLVAIVPVAIAVYALGVLIYQQLMRRVQRGDPFTQIFATIGLLFLLQNAVVAGFTSDYRFVSNTFLTRMNGVSLHLAGLTVGVPLLIAGLLALLIFVALYLLIDRSNSMADGGAQGTPKIEYARRAALEVLEQLEPADLVGAIAFDSEAYELGALAPVAEARAALAAKIHHLRPGGGTDFLAALERAGQALVTAGPPVRHVILLTDGDSNRRADDHEAVLAALADANVSVTTIRIGTDTANLDFLHTIARVTGGEFHHVTDLQTLPQLMIRDTQRKMDAAAGRRDARARVVDAGLLLAGFSERDLPPVARWALTRARPGAQLRMVVDAGPRQDPLLASWQYELGRVAVVPLDFQSSAAGWAAWPGFTSFLGRIVLWAAPRGLAGDRHVQVRRVRAGSEIRVDTIADVAGPLVVTLVDQEIVLRREGRRRFAAVVPALPAGRLRAEMRDATGVRTALELDVPATGTSGREGRAFGVATARLEALAHQTGGRMRPTPTELVAVRGGVAKESRPLEAWLVPFALVCLLADVALRRPGQGASGGAAPSGRWGPARDLRAGMPKGM